MIHVKSSSGGLLVTGLLNATNKMLNGTVVALRTGVKAVGNVAVPSLYRNNCSSTGQSWLSESCSKLGWYAIVYKIIMRP